MHDLRYLVIDDDEQFAETLARSLRRRHLEAMTAVSSRQALDRCQSWRPHRIILDLKLGPESGLNLIDKLLQYQPEARIVILTGYSSIPTTVEAVKKGAFNYLCKPVDLDDILLALESDLPATVPADPPSVDRLAWEHIQRVLNEQGGNISATARVLGMHRRTLQRKLMKRPVKH